MEKFEFDKVINYATQFLGKLSTKTLYCVLLLYYTYKNGAVPAFAKKIILGSIAYFLAPIDAIPDLTPVLGLTDDLGVLSFALVTIACYISDEIRITSEDKLNSLLKTSVDKTIIDEVNAWL